METLGFVFAETALLWGGLAAAGPVVLHLLMKTRAKTVIFPAMRFVLAGKAGRSGRLKLKHIVLLLLRMLAIALLAFALAWPSCENTSASEPVAAVFVFDNSASMEYRVDGKSRLDVARAVEIAASLPLGSELAGVDLVRGAAAPVWQTLPLPESAFSEVKPSTSSAPLGPLLGRALQALKAHRHTRKVLYVFNDRTAHAWREVVNDPSGRSDKVSVILVDCAIPSDSAGVPDNRNYALQIPRAERNPVPEGNSARFRVGVQAARVRKTVRVAMNLDGEPLASGAEFGPFRPPVDAPASPAANRDDVAQAGDSDVRVERFSRSGLKPGIHTGRMAMDSDDPLAADNTSYFNLVVGRPFKVVFVYGALGAGNAEGAPHSILAQMIQPSAEEVRTRRARVVRRTVGEPWPADLRDAALLVLMNTGDLSAAQWDEADKFVRGGGKLWWICGNNTTAKQFEAASAKGLLAIRKEGGGGAEPYKLEPALFKKPVPLTSAGPIAPVFSRFLNPDYRLGDLSACEVSRYWRIEPGDTETAVWALLKVPGAARQPPAVLHRVVERGRTLWWTFGPQRSWSNMQDTAVVAEWFVLVQETLDELMSQDAGRRTSFLLGEPVRWQVSGKLAGKDVEWGRVGVGDSLGRRLRVGPGGLVEFPPPEEPGNYRVRLPTVGDVPEEAAFSVNLDPAETQMYPQTPEWIRKRFPPELQEQVKAPGEAELVAGLAAGDDPLAGHLALVMLLMLVMESYFSNRFYKEEAVK